MNEKKEKKLKLNKTTIANLNNSGMKGIIGGGTLGCTVSNCGSNCGPQCQTDEVGCNTVSCAGGTCECITNQIPICR